MNFGQNSWRCLFFETASLASFAAGVFGGYFLEIFTGQFFNMFLQVAKV